MRFVYSTNSAEDWDKSIEKHQYEPLDKAAREVRMITLLAGVFEDPIRIMLKRTPFPPDGISPNPIFEALSYTWGSLKDPVDIAVEIHGLPAGCISVTKNLAEALPCFLLQRFCMHHFCRPSSVDKTP